MKTRTWLIGMAALAFGLSGCVTARATRSPGANLAQYHTFGWYRPAAPSPRMISFEQSVVGQSIRDQIARNLTSKGLVETAVAPDLLVSYHVKLEPRVDVTDWGYAPGWWGVYGYGPGYVTVNEYTQGTIFIDLIDPRTNTVVWHGTVSGVVNHPENPDVNKIAKAVNKVMKKYPTQVATLPPPPRM